MSEGRPAVPAATYRLQIHAGFRLQDAAELNEVEPVEIKPGDTVTVQGRSIVVLTGPAL